MTSRLGTGKCLTFFLHVSHSRLHYILYTVSKMGLVLNSIERIPKMQFSIAHYPATQKAKKPHVHLQLNGMDRGRICKRFKEPSLAWRDGIRQPYLTYQHDIYKYGLWNLSKAPERKATYQ